MKLISKFQNGGLYSGQSGFYRNDKPDDAVLNFFSDVKNKIRQSLSNINIAEPSKGGAQLKLRNPQYFNKPEIKSTKPIKSITNNTSKQQTNKQTVYKSKYDKKDDNFEGGSKKEVTVTATRSKPKTQVTTPTKQETKKPVVGSKENPKQLREITVTPTKKPTTVNNQKTTVKPKEEVKTTPKQTYLKPKGEVNMKVKLFQKMLLDEGMDLGKEGADGIWGKNTQEAFEKLQANKANYTIAMEKFKQLDEELQPKTIQTPQPFLPPRFSPASPTTLPAFKKGGTMEFIYLQKGGKINGKVNPNDGDENAIPTKEEGGTDMNPKFTKKLKPKQTTKPSPIYKPKAKTEKVEEKKKGGKMRKKCSCGCAMKISKNAKGGLIEKCSCGCKN